MTGPHPADEPNETPAEMLPIGRERPRGGALTRDQIAALITALGNSAHPLHPRAAEELTAIGGPAVPALVAALRTEEPWLGAYHAAEVLPRISDPQVVPALIEALRHPNSNVRWNAVRALANTNDPRALLALRNVADEDRGRTTWGEAVADTARGIIDTRLKENILYRSVGILKTIAALALMLFALSQASRIVDAVRAEVNTIQQTVAGAPTPAPLVRTALPTRTAAPTRAPDPTSTAAVVTAEVAPPVVVAPGIAAVIAGAGNVRSAPQVAENNVVGRIAEGDQIQILAASEDQRWFRIQLGAQRAAESTITTPDASGWVSVSLVANPPAGVPVETPTPAP